MSGLRFRVRSYRDFRAMVPCVGCPAVISMPFPARSLEACLEPEYELVLRCSLLAVVLFVLSRS